jgi:hypothetical protein
MLERHPRHQVIQELFHLSGSPMQWQVHPHQFVILGQILALRAYMGVGQLLGGESKISGGGLAKIVDTVFDAQFFSKKNIYIFFYFFYFKIIS